MSHVNRFHTYLILLNASHHSHLFSVHLYSIVSLSFYIQSMSVLTVHRGGQEFAERCTMDNFSVHPIHPGISVSQRVGP